MDFCTFSTMHDHKKTQLGFAAVLVFLLSCRESSQLTESQKASVKDEVRSMLHNYSDDIRSKGMLAEFAYLDSSADFFWVPPPGFSAALSFDTVASMIKSNALLYQSVEISWDTVRITPLTPDLASYTSRLSSIMIANSGKVTRGSLVETGLVIRRKNGWKLLCGQTALVATGMP